MKNLLLVILSICLLQSCEMKTGSGNIEKQDRKVDAFSKVEVGGSFEVIIRAGSSQKVMIEADDNVLEDIETTVVDGTLSIEYQDGVSINHADVKVYLEMPSLAAVEASASATVKIEGVLTSDKKLQFGASSSASITGEINAPATDLEVSSAGEIVMKGRTRDLKIDANSGSSIQAAGLLSENATAEASSGATIEVHASLTLKAEANSGGSINYRGEPTVTKEENSGGSVSKGN